MGPAGPADLEGAGRAVAPTAIPVVSHAIRRPSDSRAVATPDGGYSRVALRHGGIGCDTPRRPVPPRSGWSHAGHMLYADSPGRRSRQVVADLLVALWVILWSLVGRWVHDLIAALAAPALELRDAGTSIGQGLRSAGGRMTDLPLVGDRLAETFGQLAGAGDRVGGAGSSLADTIQQVAATLGLVAALGPMLSVVIPWLLLRARFVRLNRAARLLSRGPGGAAGAPESSRRPYDAAHLELFALRALSNQSLTTLAKIHPDPVGAWRRGDPAVTEQLARLELRSAGVDLPPPHRRLG